MIMHWGYQLGGPYLCEAIHTKHLKGAAKRPNSPGLGSLRCLVP
jgi:hypothetical protein